MADGDERLAPQHRLLPGVAEHVDAQALHPVQATDVPKDVEGGELLRQATRSADLAKAEQTFAALAQGPAGEAFNHLQYAVQDEMDVHRVVLAWRSWALLDLTGKEQAQTLLRQSVRDVIGHSPDSFCEGTGAGMRHARAGFAGQRE